MVSFMQCGVVYVCTGLHKPCFRLCKYIYIGLLQVGFILKQENNLYI